MSPTKQARVDNGKEPNSIGDRMEKNPWRNQAQSGGQFSSGQMNRSLFNCSKVKLCRGLIWFQWSCPDGRLGDVVFAGDPVSGAHLVVLVSADIQGFRGRL